MPIAGVGELDRLLVVGSFLRKDTPLLAQRVRQAAKRGLHVSVVGPTSEDWLLPVKARALVAPSQMVDTLLQVVFALADEKGLDVGDGFANARPAVISEGARAVALSLASGRKSAVWLGNLAVQHARAAELTMLAAEIARLAEGVYGVIGEAANSVGGYLADAVPHAGGLNAGQMIDEPRRAYVLLNAEPALDFANAAASVRALESARLVVALASFATPSLLDCADVLLPVSPFTETSGTFVSTEGRVQSFAAVAKPRGDARPAWKVLRVLGNILSLAGFEYNDSEAVAAAALGRDVASRLDNRVDGILHAATLPREGLERVADVPIHFADPLVRQAKSLQRTRDAGAPAVRVNPETLAALGIAAGERVRVKQGDVSAELVVIEDPAVAIRCLRVPAAHAATAALGAMSGSISMERV